MKFCNLMTEMNEGGKENVEFWQLKWDSVDGFLLLLNSWLFLKKYCFWGYFYTWYSADVLFFYKQYFLYKGRLTVFIVCLLCIYHMFTIVVSDTCWLHNFAWAERSTGNYSMAKNDMFVSNFMHLFRDYAFIHTSLDFSA